MSDFDPRATLRPLGFTITVVPGSTTIQGASAHYEIVLPSGRASQFDAPLDISSIQSVINAASAAIVSQLLAAEGLSSLWSPGQTTPVSTTDAGTVTDSGSHS